MMTESLSDIYFTIKAGLRVGRHLREFIEVLDRVDFNHPELSRYIALDRKRYHRSVVIRDDRLEMAVITWMVGQESGVHGHPGDCIYKVLRGTMREDLYTRKAIKRNAIECGQCGYVSNSVGYHNVKSIGESFAVTLHVYSPSFPIDDAWE